jgi:hypothetical protein
MPLPMRLSREQREAAGRRAEIVEKFMRECLEDCRRIKEEG